MKTTTTLSWSKLTVLSAFVASALLFGACKVTLLPKYDDRIAEQIENVSKAIDKFYLTMLETTTDANDERAYSKFAAQYVAIEVELYALLNRNKAREKNEHTVNICEEVINMFERYKNEHRQNNTISNASIRLNLEYLRGLLYPLMISEMNKKMAE